VKNADSYGTGRQRAASVSYAEIETAARKLMAAGDYASVAAVRKLLKRGSTTTIAEAMRRFWKNQAALDSGNPVALTRLPPELADAAVDLWEQALRLSLQTAKSDDTAARASLDELRRDVDRRVQSVELREKQWDMAARLRERALDDARQQVGTLVGELAATRAELRGRDLQNAQLEAQIEQLREQLATVIAKAVARHRSRPRAVAGPNAPPRRAGVERKPSAAQRTRSRRSKLAPSIKSRGTHGRSTRNLKNAHRRRSAIGRP
jgi:Plasmid replication region DNA-binding N-term